MSPRPASIVVLLAQERESQGPDFSRFAWSGQGGRFALREYTTGDAAAVLQLNAESVAVLSPMDADRLRDLAGMAHLHLIADGPTGIIGFMMAFADGSSYDSVNYRWFASRFK